MIDPTLTDEELAEIAARADRARDPKRYCGDCGFRIATEQDLDTTEEGEGADLCWRHFFACGVDFGISADWRSHYAADVPRLVAALGAESIHVDPALLARIDACRGSLTRDEVVDAGIRLVLDRWERRSA